LVVDAENYRPAVGICESDNALGDPLRVRKLDLQLEIRILAAADKPKQFGTRCDRMIVI